MTTALAWCEGFQTALKCLCHLKAYKLSPTSMVFHEAHGLLQLKELVKMLPTCSCVYGYTEFPPGVMPATLEPSKAGVVFVNEA